MNMSMPAPLSNRIVQRRVLWAGVTACLVGCSGVHWQTADELSAQIYASGQAKALSDCLKQNNGADLNTCQKQSAGSFESYRKEREKTKP